jgi:hypothetical protein
MKTAILSKLFAAAFVLAALAAASQNAFATATIVIQNNDAANTGFNDPTPVAPVGNNTGTTLGQQRLNAFQFAANIWGATLNSNVTIRIGASWSGLSCTSTTATLGSTSVAHSFRDFPNAPVAGTWYPAALANALSGTHLGTDPNSVDMTALFNSNLGNTGCLDGVHFYLGLDNNHGADVDLVSVLIHEFAHGLGFSTLTSGSTGTEASGFPSVYDRFLMDDATGQTWVQMGTNNAARATSATNGNLVWNGANVDNDLRGVLGPLPRLRVNAPANVVGNYAVGTADFGPPVSSVGTTANVVQAVPNDGCSALTNGSAVSGNLALIDRGPAGSPCSFVTKVKNAQNAGAIGVIIANVTSSSPPVIEMGGTDATITIPSLMISGADASTLKSQLTAGLNATLLADTSAFSGADSQGRALMYAPSTVSSGSSVSHWDTSMFPNQLMEPNISGDLIHSVAVPADLTGSQLRDIGWQFNPIGDVNFFVRQHYLDFLNRAPDSSGLQFWRNNVFGCGLDTACADVQRVNTSAAFFLSIEFQGTGYLVYKMYKASFGNLPGKPVAVQRAPFLADTQTIQQQPAQVIVGQGNWQAQLETNKQAFALAFVQRPAFQTAHGSQDVNTLVSSLFTNEGVTPTTQEQQAAISAFNNAGGGTAGQAAALRNVAESNSVTSATFNESFVLMQYFGYLQRNPDDPPDGNFSGYNFWLNKLNQFGGNFVNAEMVKAFIQSTEYRQRFGPA